MFKRESITRNIGVSSGVTAVDCEACKIRSSTIDAVDTATTNADNSFFRLCISSCAVKLLTERIRESSGPTEGSTSCSFTAGGAPCPGFRRKPILEKFGYSADSTIPNIHQVFLSFS